jgi:hypothetical protein
MSVINGCEHLIIAGDQKIPASRKSGPAVRRFPALAQRNQLQLKAVVAVKL